MRQLVKKLKDARPMNNRRVKLTISYDGTNFHGWQIQKVGRTVQGVIEQGLTKMHKYPVRVVAAGRTDSGVHANGQVCHFDTNLQITESRLKLAVNTFLPDDISVLKSIFVDNNYHARYDAKKRVYKYYLCDFTEYNVFNRCFCTPIRNMPGISTLNSCARYLVGIHDFTAFTAAGDKSESKIREIYSAVFYKEGNATVFRIEGNAFLWKMIRSIVGSILKFAPLKSGPFLFKNILDSKDRKLAGTTAPAKGLYFHKVYY